MRTAGSAALDLLLPATAGKRGEPASASPARPAVFEVPVFRKPQDGRRVGCEPQAHSTSDEHSGYRSPLSQTELELAGAEVRGVYVTTARRREPTPLSSLVVRY